MHTLTAPAKLGLPVIDARAYFAAKANGTEGCAERRRLGDGIRDACHRAGMFYLTGHNIEPSLMAAVFQEAAKFFACDEDEKVKISLKHSQHFRGYGLLKNHRDWREQLHFGVESSRAQRWAEGDTSSAEYWQLEGPNQWPKRLEFRDSLISYIKAVEALSREMLAALALSLDLPIDYFSCRMKDRPYLLTKTMSYLPQRDGAIPGKTQTGVTAHCDWSWLTFLIQDDVGGLEARDSSGVWQKVTPVKNAIVVNTGELLELETGGLLTASPHRVINERLDRQRFSVATFINPALDSLIHPSERTIPDRVSSDHVHRVVPPNTTPDAFTFGDSEWRRKAEGKWCHRAECLAPI